MGKATLAAFAVAIGLLIPAVLTDVLAEHPRARQTADERAVARFVDAARDYATFGKTTAIFTPEAAEVLRFRLRFTRWLYRYNPVETLNDLAPAKRVRTQPDAAMLDALPRLPDRLQYRLHGRHLLLIDRDTSAVIDILEDALAQ
jgi:hypothetical protein